MKTPRLESVTGRGQSPVEWLRSAAQEGFDDIDRGKFTPIRSRAELTRIMDKIQADVRAEFADEQGGGQGA